MTLKSSIRPIFSAGAIADYRPLKGFESSDESVDAAVVRIKQSVFDALEARRLDSGVICRESSQQFASQVDNMLTVALNRIAAVRAEGARQQSRSAAAERIYSWSEPYAFSTLTKGPI